MKSITSALSVISFHNLFSWVIRSRVNTAALWPFGVSSWINLPPSLLCLCLGFARTDPGVPESPNLYRNINRSLLQAPAHRLGPHASHTKPLRVETSWQCQTLHSDTPIPFPPPHFQTGFRNRSFFTFRQPKEPDLGQENCRSSVAPVLCWSRTNNCLLRGVGGDYRDQKTPT